MPWEFICFHWVKQNPNHFSAKTYRPELSDDFTYSK